jgi:hypothetical protein
MQIAGTRPCRGDRGRRGGGEAHSSTDFIVAASGIEQRYVLDKTGVLDPDVMHPWLRARSDDEPGQMAEMALEACRPRSPWQAWRHAMWMR